MLTNEQLKFYQDNGYLLVEDVITNEQLKKLQEITYEFIDQSRTLTESNDVYDLDEGHCVEQPRLTRIKLPHKQHQYFDDILKKSGVTEVLRDILGANATLLTSKLNTKSPGGGAAVEWHQDWAFYPHTNDNLLAFGLMLEDVTIENGPLQVIPGSHKGPILSHHNNGVFCGAVDPDDPNFNLILFYEIARSDAWPILGASSYFHGLGQDGFWKDLQDRIIIGQPCVEPCVENVPVRMPLPPAPNSSSIFQTQKSGGAKSVFT